MIYILYSVVLTMLIILSYKLSKKNKRDINLLGGLGVFTSLVYITWRIFFTIPNSSAISIVLGIILIMAELHGIIQNMVTYFLFSSKKRMVLTKDSPFKEFPTVDIFICTYNESAEILKRTIIASTNIDYPKEKLKVYVGDDGKRKQIETLCKKYDATYVTRTDNKHAKAGNLNNLLKVSSGDFFLVLDADFIPKEDIIKKMVAYFQDSKMGFVQAPQIFYNLDPYQYNLGFNNNIPNEQEFFMRNILEKRSNHNATLQIGTNAVFRRSAIEEIGGIPTGSITEDMATGMLLQAKGYKGYFLNECLAVGLAVESFEDYIKQRDRWARGNLQVLNKYKPFKNKNLNLKQKVVYLIGSLYWLFGLQRLVYLTFPFIYLIFGVTIFNASVPVLLALFLPSYISSMLYYKRISNNRSIFWSNVYETSIAPQIAWSAIKESFFSGIKGLKFFVTPKGKTKHKKEFKLKLATTHILFLILTLVSWTFMFVKIFTNSLPTYELMAFAIIFYWSLNNLLPIIASIFIAFEKPHKRSTERIAVALKVNIEKTKDTEKTLRTLGTTVDISEKGAKIILNKNYNFDEKIGIKLNVFIDNIGQLKTVIHRVETIGDKKYLILLFKPISTKAIHKINQLRFLTHNPYNNEKETQPKTNLAKTFCIITSQLKK